MQTRPYLVKRGLLEPKDGPLSDAQTRPYLVNDGGLQVDKDGPGDVLPRPRLAEEGVEAVVPPTHRLVRRHLAIRLDSFTNQDDIEREYSALRQKRHPASDPS